MRVIVEIEGAHSDVAVTINLKEELTSEPGVQLPGAQIDPTLQLADDLIDDISRSHGPWQGQGAAGYGAAEPPARSANGWDNFPTPVDPWRED